VVTRRLYGTVRVLKMAEKWRLRDSSYEARERKYGKKE
jgi:hypothetical protein